MKHTKRLQTRTVYHESRLVTCTKQLSGFKAFRWGNHFKDSLKLGSELKLAMLAVWSFHSTCPRRLLVGADCIRNFHTNSPVFCDCVNAMYCSAFCLQPCYINLCRRPARDNFTIVKCYYESSKLYIGTYPSPASKYCTSVESVNTKLYRSEN